MIKRPKTNVFANAAKFLEELEGYELTVNVDSTDPESIEAVVEQMRAELNQEFGHFRQNPIANSVLDQFLERAEARVRGLDSDDD